MTTEIANRPTTDLWSQIDRAFDDLHYHFLDAFGGTPSRSIRGEMPEARAARVDVVDTGNAYRIVAEVPGIPKENLDLKVRGSTVEIRGQLEQVKESNDTEYLHRERFYNGFYRRLDLPEEVVGTEAKAKMNHGLLELELPKVHPMPETGEVKIAIQ
ncbi:Heat shock protein Hsp20 domain protein [mine drainage metagenome]|uniref:Heat shock protein Hsp20 domain protein n=1 Tax=mine drainage metagenome TaxID=410659 RepID=T1AW97_9ZZZZ